MFDSLATFAGMAGLIHTWMIHAFDIIGGGPIG